MTQREEKKLMKFVYSPAYRERVIRRIEKQDEKAYNKRIRSLEHQKKKLIKKREREIERIAKSRWIKEAENVYVNRTEGKVRINNREYLFSSIYGAGINMHAGNKMVQSETGESKRHVSMLGAVVGGVMEGGWGALAGGYGFGKTQSNRQQVVEQVPTCSHLGVVVVLDGFETEIVLHEKGTVEQASSAFTRAQKQAKAIMELLQSLKATPVPTNYLYPEEEESVLEYDRSIQEKAVEIEGAIADTPVFELPSVYRTEEQRYMTDAEYLQYLADTDPQRQAEVTARKEEERIRKEEMRASGEHQTLIEYFHRNKKTVLTAGVLSGLLGIACAAYLFF